MRGTQKGQVYEVKHVDNGKKYIEFNPAFSDPSPDHDSKVRNNGGGKKEQKMNVE